MRHAILIVEDSPEDFEATLRALRQAKVPACVQHCQDGDEVLDYLHRRGRFADPADAPRPGLILLDLNLPGTEGCEVLHFIKNHASFRAIPVIVLTTSSDRRDVEATYAAGANSYIQKPVDLDSYMRLVRLIAEYWFGGVVLPSGDAQR